LHDMEEGRLIQTVELLNQSNEAVLENRRRWAWPTPSPPSMYSVGVLFQSRGCRDEGKISNEVDGFALPKDDRNPAPSRCYLYLTDFP
jgi:hypothetical protein